MPAPAPAPFLTLSPLTIEGEQAIAFDPSRLQTGAPVDEVQADLWFSVGEVRHGRFEYLDRPGQETTRFTQPEIAAGRVVFVSTSAVDQPSFTLTVHRGEVTGQTAQAQIDFRRSILAVRDTNGLAAAPGTHSMALQVLPSDPTWQGDDRAFGSPDPVRETAAAAAGPAGRPLPASVPAQSESADPLGAAAAVDDSRAATGRRGPDATDSATRRPADNRPDGFDVRISADDYLIEATRIDMLLAQAAQTRSDTEGPLQSRLSDSGSKADQEGSGSLGFADVAQASGLALTAGTVWWALRAGSLLTGLMVSLPAWRHADLLAVLPDEDDEDDRWEQAEDSESARDERSVDRVFEGQP